VRQEASRTRQLIVLVPPPRLGRRRSKLVLVWIPLSIAGILGLLAVCVVLLPKQFAPPRSTASLESINDPAKRMELEDSRLEQQNNIRTSLLQGLAGAAVAGGLLLTRRQIKVNQDGQITERFNDAIGHLSSDAIDLRLGGIHALERIAGNSSTDRSAIGEVLIAFIRHNSPWPPSRPGQYQKDAPTSQLLPLRNRAVDVQAALTAIGRGQFADIKADALDLSRTDLRGAYLRRANLRYVFCPNARLQGARLDGANLRGAVLAEANFQLANLVSADLREAMLTGANLSHAILHRANLRGANLVHSDLNGAVLDDADLRRADLEHADLQYTQLRGVDLRDANLTNANWEGAVATDNTRWPIGFDVEAAGIIVGPQ
jgi:uncharacterized protein YjbI with pentapeptide repeats